MIWHYSWSLINATLHFNVIPWRFFRLCDVLGCIRQSHSNELKWRSSCYVWQNRIFPSCANDSILFRLSRQRGTEVNPLHKVPWESIWQVVEKMMKHLDSVFIRLTNGSRHGRLHGLSQIPTSLIPSALSITCTEQRFDRSTWIHCSHLPENHLIMVTVPAQ